MTNLEFYKEYILKQIYNEQMDSFRKNPKNDFISIIYDLMNESFPDYPKDDMWTKVLNWLCEEHALLDKAEKEYLSAVIKPFKNKEEVVITIIKVGMCGVENLEINIKRNFDFEAILCFPPFKKGAMYKGMKLEEEYTLKELGL